MQAHYSIEPDRRHGMIRVTMAGFYNQDDIAAFVAALREGLIKLGTAPNGHIMLCDVRGMKIQTQEIVAAFGNVVGSPLLRSKRLAFVTGSSLSRLQTRRLTTRRGVEFFGDLASAEKWLLEPSAQSIAA